MPQHDLLHPRIDPNRSLVRVPLSVLENNALQDEFSAITLNWLLHHATDTQKALFKAHLDKHIGPDSTYVLKALMCRYLVIIAKALTDQLNQPALTLNEKTALLAKLAEEVHNCTPGFMIRVRMVLGRLNRPTTFLGVLAQYRYYLATKASYGIDEVHGQNMVISMANWLGYGVTADSVRDPHQGRLSTEEVQTKLKPIFRAGYTPSQMVSQLLDDQLNTMGYTGFDSVNGMKYGVFNAIITWIKQIFALPTIEINKLFIIADNDMVIDIDWAYLNTLLLQTLENGYLLEMKEKTQRRWEHITSDQHLHTLSVTYEIGDLQNAIVNYSIRVNDTVVQEFQSYLGSYPCERNPILTNIPLELFSALAYEIKAVIENADEFVILRAFNTERSQTLFNLLYDRMNALILLPEDYVRLLSKLSSEHARILYGRVKDRLLPLINSIDEFCQLLKYMPTADAKELCKNIPITSIEEAEQLLMSVPKDSLLEVCQLFKSRIACVLQTINHYCMLCKSLEQDKRDILFLVFREQLILLISEGSQSLKEVFNYISPENILAICADIQPTLNEIFKQKKPEFLNAYRGETLRALCKALEPQIKKYINTESQLGELFYHLRNDIECIKSFSDKLIEIITSPAIFASIPQTLDNQLSTAVFLIIEKQLVAGINHYDDYLTIAMRLDVSVNSKLFQQFHNKLAGLITKPEQFSRIAPCLDDECRAKLLTLCRDNLITQVSAVRDYTYIVKVLNLEQRKEFNIGTYREFAQISKLPPKLTTNNIDDLTALLEVLNKEEQEILLSQSLSELEIEICHVKEFVWALVLTHPSNLNLLSALTKKFFEKAIELKPRSIIKWFYMEFDRIPNSDWWGNLASFFKIHALHYEIAFKAIFPILRSASPKGCQYMFTQYLEFEKSMPLADIIDTIIYLPITHKGLIHEKLQTLLYSHLNSLANFNLIYKLLEEPQQEKAIGWLILNASVLFKEASLHDMTEAYKTLNDFDKIKLFTVCKGALFTPVIDAESFSKLASVLTEEHGSELVTAKLNQLSAWANSPATLAKIILYLKPTSNFQALINQQLKSCEELVELLVAVNTHKLADLALQVQSNIECLVNSHQSLKEMIQQFHLQSSSCEDRDTKRSTFLSALSSHINKHTKTIEDFAPLIEVFHSAPTPFLTVFHTRFNQLIQSLSDVVLLANMFRSVRYSTVFIAIQTRLEHLIKTPENFFELAGELPHSAIPPLYRVMQHSCKLNTIDSLVKIAKLSQGSNSELIEDFKHHAKSVEDIVKLLPILDTWYACKLVSHFHNRVNTNTIEGQQSFSSLISGIPVEQRKQILHSIQRSEDTNQNLQSLIEKQHHRFFKSDNKPNSLTDIIETVADDPNSELARATFNYIF